MGLVGLWTFGFGKEGSACDASTLGGLEKKKKKTNMQQSVVGPNLASILPFSATPLDREIDR